IHTKSTVFSPRQRRASRKDFPEQCQPSARSYAPPKTPAGERDDFCLGGPSKIGKAMALVAPGCRKVYDLMSHEDCLSVDQIHCGDARSLMPRIRPESIALSVWSPP